MPRYYCKLCRKTFSSRTGHPTFRQKKPYLNKVIFELYCSTLTQRRMARVLRVSRTTVVRKFLFLALRARSAQEAWLRTQRFLHLEFDEMESFEHTRLKPVSVVLAVETGSRKIVDIQVGEMPYKGQLARLAFRKYGPRKDHRPQIRRRVLKRLGEATTLTTDEHPGYAPLIRSLLPGATHVAVPSASKTFRPQGSRRNPDDPMFAINHVSAKLRADLSRLLRRVWVTTKRVERLQAHLDLYLAYHNGLALN